MGDLPRRIRCSFRETGIRIELRLAHACLPCHRVETPSRSCRDLTYGRSSVGADPLRSVWKMRVHRPRNGAVDPWRNRRMGAILEAANKGARGERTRRTGCRRPQGAGGRRVTGRLAPQAAGRQPSHGDPLRGLRLRGGGEPSSRALPHVWPCDVGRGADPRAEKLAVTHVTRFDRTFQENDADTVVLVREETS